MEAIPANSLSARWKRKLDKVINTNSNLGPTLKKFKGKFEPITFYLKELSGGFPQIQHSFAHLGKNVQLWRPPNPSGQEQLRQHNVLPIVQDTPAWQLPPYSISGIQPPRIQRHYNQTLGFRRVNHHPRGGRSIETIKGSLSSYKLYFGLQLHYRSTNIGRTHRSPFHCPPQDEVIHKEGTGRHSERGYRSCKKGLRCIYEMLSVNHHQQKASRRGQAFPGRPEDLSRCQLNKTRRLLHQGWAKGRKEQRRRALIRHGWQEACLRRFKQHLKRTHDSKDASIQSFRNRDRAKCLIARYAR